MHNSRKKTSILKLLAFIFIFSSLVFLSPSYAQKDWKDYVKDLAGTLVEGRKPGGHIYIHSFRDESNRQAYYPFMKTVGKVVANEIRKRGFVVSPTPMSVESYVMTTFLERPEALFVNVSLVDSIDGETVLASTSGEIPIITLPQSWKERSLRDVAYELTGKLEQRLFAQIVKIIFGEFSGGHTKSDAYVSDFSATMRGYIKEEMIKSGTFVLLAPSTQKSEDKHVVKLTGHFTIAEDDIIFRLILTKGKAERREIANVSTQFAKRSIPHGMAVFPQNIEIASQSTERRDDEISYDTRIPVHVWTNKSSSVYYNNERLVVYLRPEEDCYARVYYIQSDGLILQAFPSNDYEQGFLKKGVRYGVGGKKDDVELVISDETRGQEYIKVFAARYPIDDRYVSRDFIRGAKVFRIRSGYRGLQESLARGLAIQRRRLIPVAEVKILVR